ncbi:MAG: PIN domain-containing protein [Nanoarchaeota archaeon]
MQLIVDTNILVSFFRDNPVKFIILNSRLLNLELITPEYALEELKKNESDISKYGKINSEQFNNILSDLSKFIRIIPEESFTNQEAIAKELIHDKDIPFFALALSLDCTIWSNEPSFKEQSKIKILNTSDLKEMLKI